MAIIVQPVNEALFDDVQTIFGNTGQAARCQCQGYRMGWYAQHSDNVQDRRELLRDQVIEGHGLVAHLDGEPVGWCAVEPRTAYVRLQRKPLVWAGRTEEKADEGVWSMPCLITPRDTAVAASPMPWPVPRSSMRASGAPAPLRAIP
ncbi:MAG: GNAT family N-acetyltransferase [Chloroflexota bacterium]|nr:GNAT family N-acetyltransferase [Chloroflexota bacterium]